MLREGWAPGDEKGRHTQARQGIPKSQNETTAFIDDTAKKTKRGRSSVARDTSRAKKDARFCLIGTEINPE